MLGKTSISAIRTLLLLAENRAAACQSPRRLAEALGESPTYLAKVMRHMVKARILEAERGAKGGVRLLQHPGDITLLSIVEACQGAIVGDYCRSLRPESAYCGFHRAAAELHEAITGVLGRWTLEDLLSHTDSGTESGGVTCLMTDGSGCPPPTDILKFRGVR